MEHGLDGMTIEEWMGGAIHVCALCSMGYRRLGLLRRFKAIVIGILRSLVLYASVTHVVHSQPFAWITGPLSLSYCKIDLVIIVRPPFCRPIILMLA